MRILLGIVCFFSLDVWAGLDSLPSKAQIKEDQAALQGVMHASVEGSFFEKLPLEIFYKMMEDPQVYQALFSTSRAFFCLACHPPISKIMLIDSPLKLETYVKSNLLHRFPRIKITYYQTSHFKNFNSDPLLVENLKDLSLPNLNLIQDTNFLSKIRLLTNLQALNLEKNNISEYVCVLFPLQNLTYLNLAENSIEKYVSVVAHLTKLTTLHIRNNTLGEHVSLLSCLTNLTSLDVRNNWIGHYVTTLAPLTNLRELKASGNGLSKELSILKNSLT